MGGRKREERGREKREGGREKREGGRERLLYTHMCDIILIYWQLFLFSSLVPLPLRMTVMMTTIKKEWKNPRPPSAGAETSRNIKWAGLAEEGKGKKD